MTNYLVNYTSSTIDILQSLFFVSISSLPFIFPVCLFFSTFTIYSDLSFKHEILALKSLGFSFFQITFPAILFSLLFLPISLQASAYLAPWGVKKLDLLIHKLRSEKINLKIRPGVFTENLLNLVIYAKEIEKKTRVFKDVFIYDESQSLSPLVVIAKKAKIIKTTKKNKDKDEDQYSLRLFNGQLHKTSLKSHTRMSFQFYDIYFPSSNKGGRKVPSAYSLNKDEIKKEIYKVSEDPKISEKRKNRLQIVSHRMKTFPVAGLIFSLLGISLGIFYLKPLRVNVFIISSLLVAGYWALHSSFESLAKYSILPSFYAVWATNVIFLIPLIWRLRQLRV